MGKRAVNHSYTIGTARVSEKRNLATLLVQERQHFSTNPEGSHIAASGESLWLFGVQNIPRFLPDGIPSPPPLCTVLYL